MRGLARALIELRTEELLDGRQAGSLSLAAARVISGVTSSILVGRHRLEKKEKGEVKLKEREYNSRRIEKLDRRGGGWRSRRCGSATYIGATSKQCRC